MLSVYDNTYFAPLRTEIDGDADYYVEHAMEAVPISTTSSGLEPIEGFLGPGWKTLLLGTALGLAIFPVMRCEPMGRCRRAALLAAGAPMLVALLAKAWEKS
jgi:hypothetical protein